MTNENLSKVWQERIEGNLVRFTAVQDDRTICTRWMIETPRIRARLPDAYDFNIMCYGAVPEKAEYIGEYVLK